MIPYIKGKTSSQAHVDIPEGTIEEEYARNGFSGRYAHLYRSQAPVEWSKIEGPLKPRAFDFNKLSSNVSDDYIQHRPIFFENTDLRIRFCKLHQTMNYFYRNADADEVFFIHRGAGSLETDFGPLGYESGDYIVIPRGTVYRWLPAEASEMLLVESFSEVQFPEKGMLGQHALFDPAVLITPDPAPSTLKAEEYRLVIQRCDQLTTITYPFNPLNTVGWKGTLSVIKLNVRDIRPILSDRYHLPPSAHSTFVARNFVICTFLPRPLENGDARAVKVPFYHSNIDFDEILFYHRGQFFSRNNMAEGMLTFHPQGIHHGPQKEAIERSQNLKETKEIAVMIDTRTPLKPSVLSSKIEVEDYWKSWRPLKGEE